MSATEAQELAADIKAKGLLNPIITFHGQILDGRNRYQACQEMGITPEFLEYSGNDPLGDVISWNLTRRHLNEVQRASVAAKLANMPLGGAIYRSANLQTENKPLSQTQAAEMLNVSPRSVATAKKIQATGDESLVAKVDKGEVSLNVAQDIAELPKEQQKEIVAKGEKEILQAAKEIRSARAEAKRKERIEKIVEISQGNEALDISKKYPVILCDPPWRYDYAETENRAIENQYPTMALEEICALPVADIAHDDSIVFMWTTSPKLEESFKVMAAWGFTYRTCAVWDKELIGMGYYFRQQHELLLVGTKGNLPTPAPSERVSSVIREKRGEHSAKPNVMYEIIESMYQDFSKIELFCRSPRKGWDVWGNQSNVA